jgi:hypothetical protein
MPDNAPPKWMFRNISAIREDTERILELLLNSLSDHKADTDEAITGCPRGDDLGRPSTRVTIRRPEASALPCPTVFSYPPGPRARCPPFGGSSRGRASFAARGHLPGRASEWAARPGLAADGLAPIPGLPYRLQGGKRAAGLRHECVC